MKSVLFTGTVLHSRTEPQRHSFRYPVFMLGAALSELAQFARFGRLLTYNRAGLLSLRDRDYLTPGAEAIPRKFGAWSSRTPQPEAPAETYLVTSPKWLGCGFNPVSFYVSFTDSGALHSLLAEVNNTFGEKHLYQLSEGCPAPLPARFRFPKEFFVSPFMPVAGEYELTLRSFEPRLELEIALHEAGRTTFRAGLFCEARELTPAALLRTVLRHPFSAALTMTRIHFQAFILYFYRSVSVYRKPAPRSANTVRTGQTPVQRARLALLGKFKRRGDAGAGTDSGDSLVRRIS